MRVRGFLWGGRNRLNGKEYKDYFLDDENILYFGMGLGYTDVHSFQNVSNIY
jgi:hypothetical protein